MSILTHVASAKLWTRLKNVAMSPSFSCSCHSFTDFKRNSSVVYLMPKLEKIKRRHLLKKREQREILDYIASELGTTVQGLDSKSKLESGILDDGMRILIFNGDIIFFESENRFFPTLYALLSGMIVIPRVSVDMGAVRFIVNGADIMRPGITAVDDGISEGSIVAIVDETHGKALAVGVSKMSSEDLRAASKGKVVMTIHHINDDLWNFSKK